MELGDLRNGGNRPYKGERVAILAIMELGDLRPKHVGANFRMQRRNPRYNGIG